MGLFDLSDRVSAAQAQRMIGCTHSMFYRLVNMGLLPAYGVGERNRFFLKSEIRELMAFKAWFLFGEEKPEGWQEKTRRLAENRPYPEDKRLNWEKAAELCGCGQTVFFRLVKTGRLPQYKNGKTSWYRAGDVYRLFRDQIERLSCGDGKP